MLKDFERMPSLTICRQQEMGRVRTVQPANLVNLLFNFQTFEIIKLWFVALEGAINIVLPTIQ